MTIISSSLIVNASSNASQVSQIMSSHGNDTLMHKDFM